MKTFMILSIFCIMFPCATQSMSDQWQEAVLEACNNAQYPAAEAADFNEAVLDAVNFW